MENQEHAINLLFLVCNRDKNFKGKKPFKGKSNLFISGKEGRRKLTFGEIGLQICQNLFKTNQEKKFPT